MKKVPTMRNAAAGVVGATANPASYEARVVCPRTRARPVLENSWTAGKKRGARVWKQYLPKRA